MGRLRVSMMILLEMSGLKLGATAHNPRGHRGSPNSLYKLFGFQRSTNNIQYARATYFLLLEAI
jgi:hypothetical protein